MRYEVTGFKSLALALKELEPFIRNGKHLQTGKEITNFGRPRSRELLGNWLICVTVNWTYEQPERFQMFSDPTGGDGIIRDGETEATWRMEHVIVPQAREGKKENLDSRVLAAVADKQNKGGPAYASGKTLVVFVNAGEGIWSPNKIARNLPKLDFDDVWVFGLQHAVDGEYTYAVARLDMSQGNVPTWIVRIMKSFDAWEVTQIQQPSD